METVKLGVKNGLSASTPAQFITATKSETMIEFIIRSCLDVWKDLDVSEGAENVTNDFALRFDLSDKVVTEVNQCEIVDGVVLVLQYSTPREVLEIIKSLSTHGNSGADVLIKRLLSGDKDFLENFTLLNDGVKVVLDRIIYDLATHEESKMINYLLEALCLMINMSNQVLEKLEKDENAFKLVVVLTEKSPTDHSRILHTSHFLTLIQKSPILFAKVTESANVEHLVLTVLSKDLPVTVKFAALAYLNELILNSQDRFPLVQILEKHNLAFLLGKQFPKIENKAHKRHLYYVQCWALLKYQKMMNTTVDSQDQRAVSMIKELRKIAFERSDAHNHGMMMQRTRFADDYKTLGFESTVDPTQDFQKPPGLLALHLMHDFASSHQEVFNKLVMESSCRGDDCPYAMSSIGLVKVLCDVFRVDKDPILDKSSMPYYHFVLLRDQDFFQEVFAICIQHLFRTWRDMRASISDFDKVMDVTKDQLVSALKKDPQTLDLFKQVLPSYSEISESWQNANRRKGDEDCEAIKGLKAVLKPDIMDLILAQRLNYICEGTLFINQRKGHGSSKFIYVKLSPNKKTLCYDDWSDKNHVPEIEELKKKMLISDVKHFFTGNDCLTAVTHNKESRRRNDQDVDKYLTIISVNDQLELIAPDDKDKAKDAFDYWCDAIHALMGNEMTSKKMSDDLDLLLGHEVRLRLLDIEDVKLPDKAPPIPPLPPSFDIESC